jgi:hypothetical protein
VLNRESDRLIQGYSWPFDPLPKRYFDVLVVDAPAHFTTFSERGQSKSPSSQYSTMLSKMWRSEKEQENYLKLKLRPPQ